MVASEVGAGQVSSKAPIIIIMTMGNLISWAAIPF
jgi:hypothetical protein